MDKIVSIYDKGVHNLLDSEKIHDTASKDEENFITRDGKVVLVGGREVVGADGAVGEVTGLHKGYKVDGTTVLYRKIGTKIQYLNGTTWTDTITGLTSDAEYTFANYSSVAGSFTFVGGVDGLWKIVNSHPASAVDVYNASKNFKGHIAIDSGRMFLWNRAEDKTGLYGSYVDAQDSTVYTTVSGESIGIAGSTNYTGTLVFKGGGSRRTCFGVSFTDGVETFTDNYDGTLTGSAGGTGTVNYATGAYDITFNVAAAGAVTSDYQWEDSSLLGVADFSKSAPRQAGQGFVFPQDEGGDPILNVLVGLDGAYYSIKRNSVYRLELTADDTNALNEVYRKDIGISNLRSAISTGQGIVFMNTSNPTKPEMTILRRSRTNTVVEPYILFPQFKFSDYTYDDAGFATFDRWIMVFCKSSGADNNDTILMCNIQGKTVDVVKYSGKMAIQDGSLLYVGDSVTQNVYDTFSGFDDLSAEIQAYWYSKDFLFDTERLKKTRRFRMKGFIGPEQAVEVYAVTDKENEQLIGTIRGDGSYVNFSETQTIGSSMVGEIEIGGGTGTSVYRYYAELKMKVGKYRTLGIKLVPTGIGYFDFDAMTFWDILLFENRLPKSFRSKQNVSLDGTQTDQ